VPAFFRPTPLTGTSRIHQLAAIAELRLFEEKLFADVDRLINGGKDTNIA
jgi:hypothetical protein